MAGQALAVYAGLVVVVAGGLAGGPVAIAQVRDLNCVQPRALLLASLGGMALFAAVAGVALLLAVAVPRTGTLVAWAAGLVLVSYAVNYLASIWTIVRPLGPLSVFDHYDPGVITTTGRFAWSDAAVLVGIATASMIAAHVLVEHRELAST